MTDVFCVFICRDTDPTYDLQFIADCESTAMVFAAKLRANISTTDWTELSSGHHWFHAPSCYLMRVSTVVMNVPRAQQPGDPQDIRAEIDALLANIYQGAAYANHGDSPAL